MDRDNQFNAANSKIEKGNNRVTNITDSKIEPILGFSNEYTE